VGLSTKWLSKPRPGSKSSDQPAHPLDNVCHSPHIVGQTAESLVRMSVQTAENILTVLRGETLDLDFVVNPEALH
jgi:phosphoglycerate dehydrogenase-like enzyme